MPHEGEQQRKSRLIAKALGEARKRLGGGAAANGQRFIEHYYRHAPPLDLLEKSPGMLFGAALALWKFGAIRAPGEAKLRVYNPTLEEFGWKADHTVVEIVNDDMPFLVDSVTMALKRMDLTVYSVIHPIFKLRRNKGGKLAKILEPDHGAGKGAAAESFMHLEITEQSGDRLDAIRDAIAGVLEDVRAAVEDWQAMRARLAAIIAEMDSPPAELPSEDIEEVREFLSWVHSENFTFLGYREYEFAGGGRKIQVSVAGDSGLGVLRDPERVLDRQLHDLASMPSEVRAFVGQPDLVMVTKSSRMSTIHRSVHMDSIGVKRFDAKGRVRGLRVFAGLFTSAAYNRSPRNIPLLRRKLSRTRELAGFPKGGHDDKALLNILETFPRDELFQVSVDHLLRTSLGILHLQDRPRVALFVRRDDFERFVSCLVYVPRDVFNTELRLLIQEILAKAFAGEVSDFFAQVGDSPLARVHVIVHIDSGRIPAFDAEKIESLLIEAARSWGERLQEALGTARGEEQGQRLFQRYRRAFGSGYRERFGAETAVADIAKVEQVLDSGELAMSLYRPIEAADHQLWFKVYHPRRPIPLSDILPMLERMGLKAMGEMSYAVRPEDGGAERVMIHDFSLETGNASPIDLGAVRADFQDAFRCIWRGEVESDGFNALVLSAGLGWRQVVILRAYGKYLRQAGIAFSQAYMSRTLAAYPELARLIVELFETLFDPARSGDAEARAAKIRKRIDKSLDAVTSADDDRILRRFVNLVESTLRTNYYQPAPGGGAKPYLSFKLDSQRLDELPLPRPMVEVFVYSPRVEAIHLRGGKVARGGIRWSDRRQDFRTEILGLMKAQMVKNAVIVPVGSKGGFVVKRPPAEGDREAQLAEGVECYKTLMRGLLDLTDNRKGTKVVPPKAVVRRDGDDPYLVVAADKGTATFSDIANAVSADYGFWLGDAFASGGSQGYDHKKMGITARGVWESVKRHFREAGLDTQKQGFTVVGVGDMSGDVFGNGMLLSPHIRLIAAFNHRHVFIDPDPDPAKGFAERKRLFELPRSGWNDYRAKLISKGGGVFERSAKSIPLSPEIRKRFAIDKDKATPNDLIRALLGAEVDLLWFGGIGTYVKATEESHGEVGDRANDATRIDAGELDCRVVGEGANMGLTQRARIEYGLAGGRLNTDAIDNSAGVDCSDHEVNIKVLLDQVVANGDMTAKQRNALLARMTGEVGDLVLRDNYLQTQAISLVEGEGFQALDHQARLIRMLERAGRLNREVEFLPDDEVVGERAAKRQGLTRPEIAVLMSYGKIWLYDELLKSDLPDDRHLAEDAVRYFPSPLQGKFKKAIARHRLRREIVATRLTNSMINRVGGTFVNRLAEQTGMAPCDIARAYSITRQVFAFRELWESIEGLDNVVPAEVQTAMLFDVNRLIEWVTLWFLRHGARPLDIGAHIAEFAQGIAVLAGCLDEVMPEHYRNDVGERARPYLEKGVPEELALRVAGLVNLFSGCDIVRLANRRRIKVGEVARLYFAVGTRFRLGRLRAASERLEAESHWQKLAVAAMVEETYAHQLALAAQVLDFAAPGEDPGAVIAAWEEANRDAVARTRQILGELWACEVVDFSMVAVASRQLGVLAGAAKGS